MAAKTQREHIKNLSEELDRRTDKLVFWRIMAALLGVIVLAQHFK